MTPSRLRAGRPSPAVPAPGHPGGGGRLRDGGAVLPGLLAGRRPADLGARAGDRRSTLWLGLALSGPIILLRRRPQRPSAAAEPGSTAHRAGVGTHTWAEWAWLFVGSYWIVLGLFVIPARLHEFRPGDVVLFGLVPILAALGSAWSAPDARRRDGESGLDPRGGRLAAR